MSTTSCLLVDDSSLSLVIVVRVVDGGNNHVVALWRNLRCTSFLNTQEDTGSVLSLSFVGVRTFSVFFNSVLPVMISLEKVPWTAFNDRDRQVCYNSVLKSTEGIVS